MFRLVWPVDIYPDIAGLFGGKCCQFHPDLFQVKPGNFFIQLFGKPVYTCFVIVFPQINLCQGLVGKRIAHHKRRMAGCTTQVYQTAFGKQENGVPFREGKVYLSTCGLILV